VAQAAEPVDQALALYDCLLQFGRQHSNPVLTVLEGATPLDRHKYPPGSRLEFGSANWRAFYHSHSSPQRPEAEHGHFHLFAPTITASGEAEWTHVAGLSMDKTGQPLRWFAVNRWVTDGIWTDATALSGEVGSQHVALSQPVLERWLAAMVAVFYQDISTMLETRDQQLTRVDETRPIADSLEDRDIYLLAESSIDLLTTLQTRLEQE
jgi:hypothetical protein